MRFKNSKRGERGAALVEFAIAALVFLTAVFAVIEFGRLLWTHNALTDAARRGARYAVNHKASEKADAVKMTVYGTTDDGPQSPLVYGLKESNVIVTHSSGYNVGEGTVTVTIGTGCAWTAMTTDSWISITSGSSGTGSGTVRFSVGLNLGASRTGTITIAGKVFTVNQSGLGSEQ